MSVFVATQASPVAATTTQLGSLSIILVPLDQKTFTVTPPTSNSPGQWSLSLDNPSIATINGLTLTLQAVGSGQLTFTQAASGAYTSASRTTVFRITPGTPVLGSWPALTAPLGAGTYKITPPTSTSTGLWSYSLSNNVVNGYTIASLSGNIVNLVDAGTITINAMQQSTSTFLSASTSNTLQITAIKPLIGPFPDLTVSRDSIGSFNLKVPSSTSPGPWQFSSSNPSVATISGALVTPIGVGTTTITAHQLPLSGYQSTTLTMNLTITASPPTLGAFAPITYTLGAIPNNTLPIVAPTSNSSGAWVYTVEDPTIATVSGSSLVILKAGNTNISAKQNPAGAFGYSAVVSTPLVVNQKSSLPTLPNLNQVVGDPAIEIAPPATQSTGAWSLTSSDPTVAAVNGLSITVGNAGTATITLTQAAQGTWLANSTTFTVSVSGLVPTVGTLTPIVLGLNDLSVTPVNPTSNSSGLWSFASSNPAIAKIVNGKIVPVSVGVTTISAVQKPAGKYGQSNTVQSTITVKAAPIVTPTPTPSATPTPTPKPTPIPSVTPTPTPKPSKVPVVPTVSVKLIGRTLVISAKNGVVVAHINGKLAKVGKNVVKPGNDLVVIEFQSRIIYSKVFTIK
jgi:hypothetical protein